MDQTRVAIVGIIALAGLFLAALSYRFVADHWEDIKTLAVVAIIFGGTFGITIAGWRLKAGR